LKEPLCAYSANNHRWLALSSRGQLTRFDHNIDGICNILSSQLSHILDMKFSLYTKWQMHRYSTCPQKHSTLYSTCPQKQSTRYITCPQKQSTRYSTCPQKQSTLYSTCPQKQSTRYSTCPQKQSTQLQDKGRFTLILRYEL
jgi:hypothetical protein